MVSNRESRAPGCQGGGGGSTKQTGGSGGGLGGEALLPGAVPMAPFSLPRHSPLQARDSSQGGQSCSQSHPILELKEVTELDNKKQRAWLDGQQGWGAGSPPGPAGACLLAPTHRRVHSRPPASGWVKAVFIFPSAAPTSLLTQVWEDSGKRRTGWLSAQHSSSVGA